MKIKCDETKPSCKQCLKRGVTCPGYKRDLRWSDKHEVFNGQKWTEISVEGVHPSSNSPGSTKADLSRDLQPALTGQSTQITPSKYLGSAMATDASSYRTQLQQTRDPTPVECLILRNKFDNDDDRSSTSIFREDLREWLVSHDPINLLEQQGWTWTPTGPARYPLISTYDEASAFGTTLGSLDTVVSQGSELNQALVQYFFDNLCAIHTVFDDSAGSFTDLVHRYLISSPLLHKSIVCMSAAHCFQDDEDMLPMGLECHSAAVRSLSDAVFQLEAVIEQLADAPQDPALARDSMLHKLEETLLASIILGFCAPWSDPRDLGLAHLRGARKLCEYLIKYISVDGQELCSALANPDHNFLIGAMAYWEACLAFVVDQPKDVMEYLDPFSKAATQTYPHIFAGISLPLLVTLARVGICVRQKGTLRNMAAVGWKQKEAYQSFASEVLQDAMELQQCAIDYCLPSTDTYNSNKPISSTYMNAFAQMCKFSILLELRRNFPSLVDPRIDDTQTSTTDAYSLPRTSKLDHSFFDLSGAILKQARDIPEESTCGLYQTILLIICGSVLRSSEDLKLTLSQGSSLDDHLEVQLLSIIARKDEIEDRRTFIRQRLQTNCTSFGGLRQVYSRAELLLEHVWKEFDAGSCESDDLPSNRHWIDVMAEHKLETFYG